MLDRPSSASLPLTANVSTGTPRLRTSHTDFLWHVHAYTDENIRFADTKASIVIVWSAVLLGYLISAKAHHLFLHAGFAKLSAGGQAHALLGLVTFGFLAAAFLLAVLTISPNLRDERSPGFLFWKRIRAHKSAARFREQLLQRSSEDLASHLAGNVFILAGVCQRKYRRLQWAIRTACCGSLAAGVVVLLMQ
jgi:hypothetical protein